MSRPEYSADNQRGNENANAGDNPTASSLLCAHRSSAFSRLPEFLWHLRITQVFGVKIDHGNTRSVFHLDFA
jgi:hypothetical protein